MRKKILVLGAGISGLSAAAFLSKKGHHVQLIDKHLTAGGRCRAFSEDGFTFDMGPSWYWMPDLFESFFGKFGYQVNDFYELQRLNPSYRVFYEDSNVDVPAEIPDFLEMIEGLEKGAAKVFQDFLAEAKYKYDVGMKEVVYKPSLSIFEYADFGLFKKALSLDLIKSFQKYIDKKFKNPKLKQLLSFPVLFLGAAPKDIPALYTMMNYADTALGTWYPKGGMHNIAKAFEKVAKDQGVSFLYDTVVNEFRIDKTGNIDSVLTDKGPLINFDVVLSTMDYHHTEMLLPESKQSYSKKYWDNRKLSPSSLLFYLGVDEKIDGLEHHNLFFDTDFDKHSDEIYEDPKWPSEPLFYVCCPSKTDNTVAPEGKENLFVLIPIAPDLEDSKEVQDKYYKIIMQRLQAKLGVNVEKKVIYKKTFSVNDFKSEYNSFKGNAYGLANTLLQTAFLKPKMKSKKVKNLYFAGQLTVPGPGLPPSIISGELAANVIDRAK